LLFLPQRLGAVKAPSCHEIAGTCCFLEIRRCDDRTNSSSDMDKKPQVYRKTDILVAFALSAQTSWRAKSHKLPRKQGNLLLLRNSEMRLLNEFFFKKENYDGDILTKKNHPSFLSQKSSSIKYQNEAIL